MELFMSNKSKATLLTGLILVVLWFVLELFLVWGEFGPIRIRKVPAGVFLIPIAFLYFTVKKFLDKREEAQEWSNKWE
jgi:Na+(H+)/acetate symporter ActP